MWKILYSDSVMFLYVVFVKYFINKTRKQIKNVYITHNKYKTIKVLKRWFRQYKFKVIYMIKKDEN